MSVPPLDLHRLRDAALGPSTLRAYSKSLDNFLTHTRHTLPELLMLRSAAIDKLLAAYLEYMFWSRGSYDYACQAVYGLIFNAPFLRHKLGEARLCLRGWKRLKQSRSHPPLTWELAVVFAFTMAKWGYHSEAVATLLAFDCYLRVGELTRIQYHDVLQPHDPRTGSAQCNMAVRLAVAKTGLNQSVTLQSPAVAAVLRAYLLAFPFLSEDRIFQFTPSWFRVLLHRVSVAHGLGHIPYVPHSLRHGGATSDFLRGATIEQIMFRGRWVSMESARRYVQTCQAMMIIQSIPPAVHSLGLQLVPELSALMCTLLEAIPSRRKQGMAERRVRFGIPSLF